MAEVINIKGLDKAKVLAALYNNSRVQGFWEFQPGDHKTKIMSYAEAQQHLASNTYFDYLEGRVMKVDLSGDELNTWGFDRDNGEHAARNAIAEIR